MVNTRTSSILMNVCLMLGLFYLWQDTAEAARLGRSRSFGSRPSYQRSTPPPTQSPTVAPNQSGRTVQPESATGAMSSPMGRWRGMLGGMLMGGLVGSLLFGGGHGFAGPGLLDLLLIGGGLFLLFRHFSLRQRRTQSASTDGALPFDGGYARAWGSGASPAADAASNAVHPPMFPPGFDAEAFSNGANAVYVRLQNAWDKRDLEDIRQFTASAVFEEIRRQAQEDPEPGKTELLLINHQIIEARDVGNQTVVSALYDVMLRENEDSRAKQVRELWHFSRDRENPNDFWLLEGIQQVEP